MSSSSSTTLSSSVLSSPPEEAKADIYVFDDGSKQLNMKPIHVGQMVLKSCGGFTKALHSCHALLSCL